VPKGLADAAERLPLGLAVFVGVDLQGDGQPRVAEDDLSVASRNACGAPLTPETSAGPAGLMARARPEARPDSRAANLWSAPLPSWVAVTVPCCCTRRGSLAPLVCALPRGPGRFAVIQRMRSSSSPYDLHTIRTQSTYARWV